MTRRYLSAKTCCFTGHRPEKLPWRNNEKDPRCVLLKKRIYDVSNALYHSGINHFICGMALGCDTYFCEAVITLRDDFGDVTLEAAIPCEGQYSGWTPQQKERYFYLVSQCDDQTVLQSRWTPECMLERNKYMVDASSVLFAVYNGSRGGTMHTINYAKKSGREIVIINPDSSSGRPEGIMPSRSF